MLLDTDDYFQLGAKSRECHFIGYLPGQRGYRVHLITANRFFTYGNVIFDENMAYNSIPSIPASTHDYSTLPFLDQSDAVFPAVPELPINLDMTPTSQPPHLDAEPLHRTRSRDGSRMQKPTEKGGNFEKKIEVGKARLERILEVAARRGGERDDNPFAALCDSGVLDESRTESAVMATSQHDIDSGGYDMSIAPATYSEAERRMDAAQWQKLTEREFGDGKRMGVYEDVDKLAEGKKPIGCRIYKARLITRGFSRVPFVDYRAHHPPPLSPGLWRLHSVVTPLDPSHPLGRDDDAIDNFTYAYQHLIGTLLFLQLCSRPDMVLVLSQFCSAPLPHHYAIARRILRYLKGTKHFRLDSTLNLWHYRMGHPGEPATLAFLKFVTDSVTSSTPRATTLLELIHLNICGPFRVTMPHGKAYFALCLNDASSVVNLQNLALRSDVPDAWRILKVKWELQRGCLEELEELSLGGIEVENLTSTSALPSGITPFEVFYGRKTDISHLHVWGNCCFAMLMGYPHGERGYRNIPDNFIHFVFTSMHDYSTLPFLGWRNSHTPAVTALNPSNLKGRPSHIDTEDLPSRSLSPSAVPVLVVPPPPPQIAPATPDTTCTRSRDPSVTRRLTEGGQISEKKIEADKVREAAAQRGGVLDWGVMDRRADRWVHKRDYTARGTWIHQKIYSDSLPAEHESTSCNSVEMPLDPSDPLDRDGRSVVGVSGCRLGRDNIGRASIPGFVWRPFRGFQRHYHHFIIDSLLYHPIVC
jgi:hypothetical protein